ncbi:MAG: histone deacetylase [Deltaproteobacteria bacterium]|nr:histone deacetylase [Deltaproteobacteria bacterium]
MTVRERIHVVEDIRFQDHRSPAGHPERPERLRAVSRAIARDEGRIARIAPRMADPVEILRVHDRDHLAHVERAAARAPIHLDPDTYLSEASFAVASLAAGSTVEAARRVARGEARSALAAVRPPGHHAEADRAMGFCIFNNVAIAARALQQDEGLAKILILDWDVHHGNGTQHSFAADPSILYVSTHQFPHYPGTGNFAEVGTGKGEGATVNIPMPAGCGDSEYLGALQRILAPIACRFAPELILVSCGFDAHRDDPLASMEIGRNGYLAMTRLLRELAEELCGGRIVFVLEGGYAESGLIDGTTALLEAMLEETPPAPDRLIQAPSGSTLHMLVDRVAAAQSAHHPEIGTP